MKKDDNHSIKDIEFTREKSVRDMLNFQNF